MSLLMDALRRAEEAKRAGSHRTPVVDHASELSLEVQETPLTATSSRKTRNSLPFDDSPDSSEAEPGLDNFSSAPPSVPPIPPLRPKSKAMESEQRQTAERSAARNVFTVKQAPPSRWRLWTFLAFAVASTLGLVGYFWWQLQAISSPPVPRSPTQPPLQASIPTPAAPVASQAPSPTTKTPETLATGSGESPPLPAALPPSPPKQPSLAAPPLAAAKQAATRPAPASRPAVDDSPTHPANSPLFRSTNPRAGADPSLEAAYKAWHANRLDEARRLYEQILRHDPRNVDALLGVAAIAARQGQSDRAQQLYLRVLEADPGDVTAQAALINLRGQSDGGHGESRLRTLLASQPESPALHFALGNVFARQQRWKEAQQAYFQAYTLEPDNADYLFNVAVSLDHLRQDKLAAQYYRLALDAAEKGRGVFERSLATRRLAELQP
ncbi:MAG: tetratricopeptide repeat protein [Candidatus Accumulibacter sp.]|nr:tetratricopeptide repeat protein [Accumulibacter sp.]